MERGKATICHNYTPNTPTKHTSFSGETAKTHERLTDFSPKDAKWDLQRKQTERLAQFLETEGKFEKWAVRMQECADVLRFGWAVDPETAEINLKLRETFFCHCRHCVVCDKAKSLLRMRRFKEHLPMIETAFPTARWIFLTLTVPNCPIDELRATLGEMNKAWTRLIKRKEFKPVLGWIRATEVTQEKKRLDYAHPHFHVLLLVPSNWFTKNYVKHQRWFELWQECTRDDRIVPSGVHVRAVKGGADKGALETLKAFNYSLKTDELLETSPEWLLVYMEQVHNLRFLSAGGALKDAVKKLEEEPTDQELIHAIDDENKLTDDNGARIAFKWKRFEMYYGRFAKADK